MKINFNTNNIFLICYPQGAAGKFISLCLSVSNNFLPQHMKLAEKKIKEKWNEDQSFKNILSVFETKEQLQKHYELGCSELGAYGIGNIKDQEKNSTIFWKQLTNQKEYNFCLVGHSVRSDWPNYINSKKIILKNFEWILKDRYRVNENNWIIGETNSNEFIFDMNSIKNKNLFLKEIIDCCNFFNIIIKNTDLLEMLRLKFFKTYKIGF